MNEPLRPLDLQPIRLQVPVFNCIVHVIRNEDGSVTARVANLTNVVCTASSERDALARIVKEFKKVIKQFAEQGGNIPWVEPPSPKEPNEQSRFIPVHL